MSYIFRHIFLKLIRSLVLYFLQLIAYLRYFIIQFVIAAYSFFFKFYSFISKNIPPCCKFHKIFALSFLMIGIFLHQLIVKKQRLGISGIQKLPYPWFDHYPDLTEIKIFFERNQNFFNFKKINTSIIFSKHKQFMKINIRKIFK